MKIFLGVKAVNSWNFLQSNMLLLVQYLSAWSRWREGNNLTVTQKFREALKNNKHSGNFLEKKKEQWKLNFSIPGFRREECHFVQTLELCTWLSFIFSFYLSTNFFCFTLGINFQNFALCHLVSFANFDAAQMFPGKNVLRFIFWVKTRKTKLLSRISIFPILCINFFHLFVSIFLFSFDSV